MFTGLVEEMGQVQAVTHSSSSTRLSIACKKVIENANIGDSIMTDGVCLTAVEIQDNLFSADVMHETLNRSTLGSLNIGQTVNLEKSLTLQSFLGGHLVTGDVDCQGTIRHIQHDGIAQVFSIVPDDVALLRYVVLKGRISIDGASLTVMALDSDSFSVSLIPHTLKNITIGQKMVGMFVNLEFDLIAKHIERSLKFSSTNSDKPLTADILSENGFHI